MELHPLNSPDPQMEFESILVQDPSSNDLSSTDKKIYRRLLRALKFKDFPFFEKTIQNMKESTELHVNYVLKPDSKETCLDIASKNGLTDFVKLLLQEGADPNRINEIHDRAPIHFATEGLYVTTLAALLKVTNPDLQAGQLTALHFAVINNDLECAALLLKKGANASIPNKMGLTAFDLAVKEKQYKMVELILKKSRSFPDIYKDYNGQRMREVIQKILPRLPLPEYGKNDVTVQELQEYLNSNDVMKFLLKMENVKTDISSDEIDELLGTAAELNLDIVVIRILEKFKGKFTAIEAAEVAAILSHNTILREVLPYIKPEVVRYLLLTVCRNLRQGTSAPKRYQSNKIKCLKSILQSENMDDIRCCIDEEGNTPLHYAAKTRCDKVITLLLERGNYIGHMNKNDIPPIAYIPIYILWSYFNNCLQIRKTCDDRCDMKKYVIEFDYNCLMPHYYKDNEMIREMEVFQYIANNNDLKQLLEHPVLSSFLYLKWHNIRYILYSNFVFYLIFYFFLNIYIYNSSCRYPENQNKTFQIVNDNFNITLQSPLHIVRSRDNFLRIFIIMLLLLFIFWEILQLISCPWHYLKNLINLKNLLHNILIGLTIVLMCGVNQAGIDTILILLSAWKLIMLISQHKSISTSYKMFWMVSINYMRLFFPFIFFIFAFALVFCTLFKEKDFSDFMGSIFKTIIMLTGELDTDNIPFDRNFIWSHIVFILFLFFITIVLLNLLNGLAVNNTAEILSKAKLIELISSIHLIAYIEDIAIGKFCRYPFCRKFRLLRKWNPFVFFSKKIFLFPHKIYKHGKINVEQNYSINDIVFIAKDYDRKEKVNDNYWITSKMDPNIMERAKQIILNESQLNTELLDTELLDTELSDTESSDIEFSDTELSNTKVSFLNYVERKVSNYREKLLYKNRLEFF